MLSKVSTLVPCDGSRWLWLFLFLLCLHCLTQTCARDGKESRDATPPLSLPPDLVNTPCFKHKTCYECLQDPCSRAMRLNNSTSRHALPAICVWCKDLATTISIRQACLPVSLTGSTTNYCSPDNLLLDGNGDVCNSSSELREEKKGNCVALGDNFAVNLNSRSLLPVQLHEYPGVWLSFGLCNSVPPSNNVAEVCGSRTPLEAVQIQDSLMLTQRRSLGGRCWYGGIRAAVSVALHSMSNPYDGVTVSYGPSNCCPAGHVDPGVFNEVNVTVRVSPAWEHCDNPDYVAVNTTDIPKLRNFLYSCTSNRSAALEYHVLTSQLCPQYIDWELDANATSFYCEKSGAGSHAVVKCSVFPVCFRGCVCSQHVCSYPHIVLKFTNTTGESWNMALNAMTDRFNGTCSFVYKADGLHGIEAFYEYYYRAAVRLAGENPFVLSWGSDSDILTRSFYSVIYVPFATFFAALTVFLCCWCNKRKRFSSYTPLKVVDGNEGQQRSVCTIACKRDKKWASKEIESRLKEIPNLHIRVTDKKCCGKTKMAAMTDAVESSNYVIIVVSGGVSTDKEDTGFYNFMIEKAEKRKVHTTVMRANPFLVSRDGCMEVIPKNLNQDCCADFSTPDGWNTLRKAIEEHEESIPQ